MKGRPGKICPAFFIMSQRKLQKKLDEYHALVTSKEISTATYMDLLDDLEREYPDLVNRYFSKRKDNRSLAELGQDLLLNVEKERMVMDEWVANHGRKHFSWLTSYESAGIDNTGRLVAISDNINKPDYLLLPNNIYLEVKTNPRCYKVTYKKCNLESYLSDNSYVLTLFSSPIKYYTLLSPNDIERILKSKCKFKKYREVGYKTAVQFYFESPKPKNLDADAVYFKDYFERYKF